MGSKDSKELAEFAARHDAKPTTKLEEVLDDKRVDGILIASPKENHKETLLKCIESKKYIICEKPLALNEKDSKECEEAAKKKGVALLVGFQRRHDESFRSAYDRVRSGEIGDIQLIRSISRDPPAEEKRDDKGLILMQ